MANGTIAAILQGLGRGASALQEQRRYEKAREDEDRDKALARAFQERQFKAQLASEKMNRYLQQAQLDLQSGAQKNAANQNAQENALKERGLAQQDYNTRSSALLDQAKESGYIPSPSELNANVAAGQLGLNPIRPLTEILEAARNRANIQQRNVDLPEGGTVVYNPSNMTGRASMYNAQSDALQGYLRDHAIRMEQARNAVLHQYKADDPIFPLDEATRARVNALAEAEAQKAGDAFADNVYRTAGIDVNGKHKRGLTPPPAAPAAAPDWRSKYGAGLTPSGGSPAASPPSQAGGVPYQSFFK